MGHTLEALVEDRHLDQYDHVNVMEYLQWCTDGQLALLRESGFDVALIGAGVVYRTTKLVASYGKETKLGEQVTITTTIDDEKLDALLDTGGGKLSFTHVVRGSNGIKFEAQMEVAVTDSYTGDWTAADVLQYGFVDDSRNPQNPKKIWDALKRRNMRNYMRAIEIDLIEPVHTGDRATIETAASLGNYSSIRNVRTIYRGRQKLAEVRRVMVTVDEPDHRPVRVPRFYRAQVNRYPYYTREGPIPQSFSQLIERDPTLLGERGHHRWVSTVGQR